MRKQNEKSAIQNIDEDVLSYIGKLPPEIGVEVLKQYQSKIPFVLREAVNGFYAAQKQGEEAVDEALRQLKTVCEANPAFQKVYEIAKREAKGTAEDNK